MAEKCPINANAGVSVDEAGTSTSDESTGKEVAKLRDSPLRFFGYIDEVGEAFRPLVHVNLVRLSVSTRSKLLMAAADTIIWQALASIIIPGVTVNRVCTLSLFLFKRVHQPAAEDQPAHHTASAASLSSSRP
ncbi:mitochondrial fission process protein 1-like [Haemaphysalis longicornis]